MIVLGIDPGKTIGAVKYDSEAARIVGLPLVTRSAPEVVEWQDHGFSDITAIERPVSYRGSGRDVSDACEQAGWILGSLGFLLPEMDGDGTGPLRSSLTGNPFGYALERRAVKRELSAAVGSSVEKDSGVWRALVDLHGGKDCRPNHKGGAKCPLPLHGVTSHARAALAVAWAAARIHEREGK